jgi:hypothetical protein
MSQTADNIKAKINVLANQASEQVEFMETRVILLDDEKGDIDNAITAIDKVVQNEIDDVNTKIKNVSDAYNARYTAGCRSLMRWKLLSFTTLPSFTLTYKTYEVQPTGIGETIIGIGGTLSVEYLPGSRPGYEVKNLYGIKYYDEPHTKDVTDTLVGSFIGTIGIGSSVLTVMSLKSSGAIENMQIGNLIISERSNVFPGITSIVGFSTAEVDLSAVGIGSTGDIEVVDTIILSTNAAVNITAPMSDGLFVEFDAIKSSTQIDISTIPMIKSPLVPQTIGIMNSSTLGIGTYVKYDNSGNPNQTQSWNPFLKGIKQKKVIINEPIVGSGYTFFAVGFGSTPAIYTSGGAFIRYATLGEEITIISGSAEVGYQNLPSCPTQETNLTNALSALSTKESEISSGVGVLNGRLSVSNALRTERNRYTLQIWGVRQTLSELTKELNNLNAAKSALDDPVIAGILT